MQGIGQVQGAGEFNAELVPAFDEVGAVLFAFLVQYFVNICIRRYGLFPPDALIEGHDLNRLSGVHCLAYHAYKLVVGPDLYGYVGVVGGMANGAQEQGHHAEKKHFFHFISFRKN